jgi:hypothetical protein
MPRYYRWGLLAWALAALAYCLKPLLQNDLLELVTAVSAFAVWFAMGLWSLAVALRAAMGKRLRVAVLACLVPLASCVLVEHGADLGQIIRFQSELPDYVAELTELQKTQAEPIVFFPWGAHPDGDGIVARHGVVFDPDGLITQPVAARKAGWRARKVPRVLLCEADTQRMGQEGFYLGWFYCPPGS